MAIITSPLKLSINCAKHGSDFYKDAKCPACIFLLHYNLRITAMRAELEELTKLLGGQMVINAVVATGGEKRIFQELGL